MSFITSIHLPSAAVYRYPFLSAHVDSVPLELAVTPARRGSIRTHLAASWLP